MANSDEYNVLRKAQLALIEIGLSVGNAELAVAHLVRRGIVLYETPRVVENVALAG